MPDEPNIPNQPPPPVGDPVPTPDGQGKKPGDPPQGADPPPAKPEAKADPNPAEPKIDTNSPEFKAALTAAIQAKLPQLQRQAKAAIAKELSGKEEGEPTIEELKTKITERDTKLRTYEARDQMEQFVADKRNNIQAEAASLRGIFKQIKDDLEYDEQGKVTNFKEALAAAKIDAPGLFVRTGSIDAGAGARQNGGRSMNDLIRGT